MYGSIDFHWSYLKLSIKIIKVGNSEEISGIILFLNKFIEHKKSLSSNNSS